MLKNNVPAPSCIPPAGLEVLTRRFVLVLVLVLERGYSHGLALQFCGSALSELHPRGGLKMLKGDQALPPPEETYRRIGVPGVGELLMPTRRPPDTFPSEA